MVADKMEIKTNANQLKKTMQPVVHKSIILDFDSGKKGGQKRSSFLPPMVDDPPPTKHVVTPRTYCGAIHLKPFQSKNKMYKFVTGSKYLGHWNNLGIAGKGMYKYPHGVIYDGYFNKNGEFHGAGALIYPNGQRVDGFWNNGKLSSTATQVSRGNYMFNENYCQMPDRRFGIEIETELQPAGHEYLTNAPEADEIPEGCYDAGDGYYDPTINAIRAYHNVHLLKSLEGYDTFVEEDKISDYEEILERSSSDARLITCLRNRKSIRKQSVLELINRSVRRDWIETHCRRAWTESTGFRPELYELWTSGAYKYEKNLQSANLELSTQKDITATMALLPVGIKSGHSSAVSSPWVEVGNSISSVARLSSMFISTPGVVHFEAKKSKRRSRKKATGSKVEKQLKAQKLKEYLLAHFDSRVE